MGKFHLLIPQMFTECLFILDSIWVAGESVLAKLDTVLRVLRYSQVQMSVLPACNSNTY